MESAHHCYLADLLATTNMISTPSVLVPVGKVRDLPEAAMMVIRDLWARLGYQGGPFVDMQVEITKELMNADFARFEREMLCNEINSLRQELDLIRHDRNRQAQRAETATANLSQVIDAEERTFKALLSEREVAKRALERAEQGVQKVVIAKEKEAVRAEVMSEELRRLEKERIAAVLFAKTAEEQAAVANATAQAAAAVAVSATQANMSPLTPRSTHISPRTPLMCDRGIKTPQTTTLPEPTLHHCTHHHRPATPHKSPCPAHLPGAFPAVTSAINNTSSLDWNITDEALLQSKIRQRKLEAESDRLSNEASRLAHERVQLEIENERWNGLSSVAKNSQTKSVNWNEPIESDLESFRNLFRS